MSKKDLFQIIEKTGGKVLENANSEKVFQIILVPEENSIEQNVNLSKFKGNKLYSHKWILDSISNAKRLNADDFCLSYN